MHRNFKSMTAAVALAALVGLITVPMTSCENLPGTRTQQSTVIGGAGGAAIGAVLAKQNRLVGALIGGLLGAGGGYLIGAKTDWFKGDRDSARNRMTTAVEEAQRNPATAEQARRNKTADINNDGFVTIDEVLAMKDAGLSDSQMIKRLEATDQVFDLNAEQRQVLRDHGVSDRVITRMEDMNRDQKDRLISSSGNSSSNYQNDVISHERD